MSLCLSQLGIIQINVCRIVWSASKAKILSSSGGCLRCHMYKDRGREMFLKLVPGPFDA